MPDYGRVPMPDQLMRVYSVWQTQNPTGSLDDYSWWVEQQLGRGISEMLTDLEVEQLMSAISTDPVISEAVFEGLEAGP